MKRLFFSIIFVVSFFVNNISVNADVYVNGYTRKDGTYVQPYYRSSPDGNPSNNWSTYSNVNPYTGRMGTNKIPSYQNNELLKKHTSSLPPVIDPLFQESYLFDHHNQESRGIYDYTNPVQTRYQNKNTTNTKGFLDQWPYSDSSSITSLPKEQNAQKTKRFEYWNEQESDLGRKDKTYDNLTSAKDKMPSEDIIKHQQFVQKDNVKEQVSRIAPQNSNDDIDFTPICSICGRKLVEQDGLHIYKLKLACPKCFKKVTE